MVDPWWQLAGIAAMQGRVEEAIALYERCLAIDPSLGNFVRRRIDALRGTRRP